MKNHKPIQIMMMAWVLAAAAAAPAQTQQYVISTIAGGSFPDTPVPADRFNIGYVNGVATDSSGNTYFTSPSLQAVYKVDTKGMVTRIAGNRIQGYSGDGGPATAAELGIGWPSMPGPIGLALDAGGNLFIADPENNRVRRVSPDGMITTVAGNGVAGFSGDGGDATAAKLFYPTAIALDRTGNLYIADVFNHRVRKVSTNGIITTVAGDGNLGYSQSEEGGLATSAKLNYASGLAVDRAGNLFIVDLNDKRVLRVTPDGIINTVAGGGSAMPGYNGSATGAQLRNPVDVAVDDYGNLFISEFRAIDKVDSSGTLSLVVGVGVGADPGPIPGASLGNVYAVKVDRNGGLVLADTANFRIRRVANGAITNVAGTGVLDTSPCCALAGDGGPATLATLAWPNGVTVDSAGSFWITDTGHHQIRKVSTDGTITTVAGSGTYGFVGDGGPAANAVLSSPMAPVLDGSGNLYFIDSGNARVRKISSDGTISTVAGNGHGSGPLGDGGPAMNATLSFFDYCNTLCGGLAVDRAGNLYIADPDYPGLRRVTPDGIISTIAGNGTYGFSGDGGQALAARMGGPAGVAVDDSGNIYFSDINYYRVRRIAPNGIITTVAGNASLSGPAGDGGRALDARLDAPSGLATDSAGNLYIADPGWFYYTGDTWFQPCCDNRIRIVTPGGLITTIAGNGSTGFLGDGGPASTATLNAPVSVAVDTAGNVYVADSLNSAIRRLHPSGRSVLIGAVADAARQNVQAVSPGKIVVIYGAGLGPAQLVQNQPVDGRYGTQAGGTTVSFNGLAAPVLYASATQVSAVAPYGLAGTSAEVTVTYNGETSPGVTVPVAPVAPSLFALNQQGYGQAAAINEPYLQPNSPLNPARVGEYILLYATGEGQTLPAGVDGLVVNSTSIRPAAEVRVFVDGILTDLEYAGEVPGMVAGIMQLDVQIPVGTRPGGYVPVVLQVGDQRSSLAVWVAVSAN